MEIQEMMDLQVVEDIHPDEVQEDPQDHQEEDHLVPLDPQETRDPQVHLDHEDTEDLQSHRDPKDLQDHKGFQDK